MTVPLIESFPHMLSILLLAGLLALWGIENFWRLMGSIRHQIEKRNEKNLENIMSDRGIAVNHLSPEQKQKLYRMIRTAIIYERKNRK